MIIQDANRILTLQQEIKELVGEIETLSKQSSLAQRLSSIPGFGKVTIAELAGEIGVLERFASQASLALYLGMAPVDRSSGKRIQARAPKHINVQAKMALMAALAKHIQIKPEAKRYYQKKRAEGKKHNQAVRAFGRHMVTVIWTMLKNNSNYQIKKS